MALPTLVKTWQYDVNQVIAGQATDKLFSEQVMLAWKTSFISFATSPWTVVASSNGTTADLTDNWNTVADLTWSQFLGVRSWILLRQTGIATNFEVLIDLDMIAASYEHQCSIYTCPDGFDTSSISTSVLPVSNSSRGTSQSRIQYCNNGNTTGPGRLHMMLSDDGAITRWVYCEANALIQMGMWQKINDGLLWTPGWDDPYVRFGPYYPSYANFFQNVLRIEGYYAGSFNGNFFLTPTSEFYDNDAHGQFMTVADEETGEWPMCPMGLACLTEGMKGPRRGTLEDIWWGSTALNDGDLYPLTPSPTKEFVQVGDMIIPWNGTDMELI